MAVDNLKEYIIPYVGLSLGNHGFSYFVDDKFFALFEESEISRAGVKIELDLNRSERMIILNFTISGFIGVTCSRCLDEFDMEVSGTEEFFIKFGSEYREEDDNVLIIPENETHIEISGLIYDYLHLMIPYRVIHPDNEAGETTCDPEVIKRLIELSLREESDIDSPWGKLKDLNLE